MPGRCKTCFQGHSPRRDPCSAAIGQWRGAGTEEKGYAADSGRLLVEVDPRYFQPTAVDVLRGNPAKAHEKLGWRHKTSFRELVSEMVAEDLKRTGDPEEYEYEPPRFSAMAPPAAH